MRASTDSCHPSVEARASLGPDLLRALCVVGRMPLASAANVASVLDASQAEARRRLQRLHRSGWLGSVHHGMLERAQDRWFLTSRAAMSLYATDDARPSDRGVPPLSPFIAEGWEHVSDGDIHGHVPWTASARGIRRCMRRLAALEMLYWLAPDLVRNGDLLLPAHSTAASPDLRMADFRLLRYGGWHHAIAHYGEHLWVTFTFAGLHATERALRRKQAHRFWRLDCYSHKFDRHELAEDRVFYEDPKYEAEPSAQVVLAIDPWAAQLAQRAYARLTPPLVYTPEGRWSGPVELRRSSDAIADPVERVELGRAERLGRWRRDNMDLMVISDPVAFSVFMVVAEHPGMRSEWIQTLLGASRRAVGKALYECIEQSLIAQFDGRCYLTERGMRRAANVSRVLASSIISRHGMYLHRGPRQITLTHDDGVNGLVVEFARQGARAYAGWRGEINLPDITQIKPDLVVLVSDGPFGSGAYCIEYERSATSVADAARKIGPYQRCAAAGRRVPVLMVCETERAARNFGDFDAVVPLLVTDSAALASGRLTGETTVWRRRGHSTVSLHCRS